MIPGDVYERCTACGGLGYVDTGQDDDGITRGSGRCVDCGHEWVLLPPPFYQADIVAAVDEYRRHPPMLCPSCERRVCRYRRGPCRVSLCQCGCRQRTEVA